MACQKFYADELAEFVSKLKYGELPHNVVEKSKSCLLDWLGVALFGSTSFEGKIISEFVRDVNKKAESTLLDCGEKVCCTDAAFANGTMAHSSELDDTILDCVIHPGSVICATAMAVGELAKGSGKEVLNSIVAGYEVMARIAIVINTPPRVACHARGFHPTGTCGVFGAVATTSKILDLNPDEIANAFGIAGSFSSGLRESAVGGNTKKLHPGKAAHDGILATLLARRGYTGPRSVFEGRNGFWRAYSDYIEPEKIAMDLGRFFYIMKTSFKLYACCHQCHSSIDGILKIMEEGKIEADEIERVRVKIPTAGARVVAEPIEEKLEPKTTLEAKLSLPYCLSVAILHGEVSQMQFAQELLRDERILNMARKVNISADEELDSIYSPDRMPAVVEVSLKNGRHVCYKVKYPRGFHLESLSQTELEEKFRDLTSNLLSDTEASALIDCINRFEELDNVDQFWSIYSRKFR